MADAWMQRFGTVTFYNARDSIADGVPAMLSRPPEIDAIDGAFLTARAVALPRRQLDGDRVQRRCGAIHDGHGILRADLLPHNARALAERADPDVMAAARMRAADHLPGVHLYGGEYKTHYGHFLLETLKRAWAFAARPAGARVLFHRDRAPGERDGAAVTGFARELLAAAGVDAGDIVFVDRDIRVDQLLVPATRFEIPGRASPDFPAVFRRMAECWPEPAGDADARIYLTRRLIDERTLRAGAGTGQSARKRRRAIRKSTDNEHVAEELFRARGFAIVAPEQLPIGQQVALMRDAAVVAGITGSALHAILFNRNPRLRTICLDNRLSPNQIAIERSVGARACHVFCNMQRSDGPASIDRAMLERALAAIDADGA